jgi:hypothetical protein
MKHPELYTDPNQILLSIYFDTIETKKSSEAAIGLERQHLFSLLQMIYNLTSINLPEYSQVVGKTFNRLIELVNSNNFFTMYYSKSGEAAEFQSTILYKQCRIFLTRLAEKGDNVNKDDFINFLLDIQKYFNIKL